MFGRTRKPDHLDETPLAAVTVEHLKAAVDAAVGPIKSEQKWQRWLIFALAAAVFGPKVPGAPAIAALSADPAIGPHALAIARAALHV